MINLSLAIVGVLSFAGGFGIAALGCWRREKYWRGRLAAEQSTANQTIGIQRREALEAQAQQRTLFESMVEGVLLLDQAGKITMANQSARELFRVQGEFRGRTLLEAARIPLLAELALQLPQKGIIRNAELELPAPPQRFLEINASAIADGRGVHHGAIFVIRDLTRIKQLENTRREFVANVSHELRTPLSLIKGFVETLLEGAREDPEQTERFLLMIQKHANRLAFLIEDLLTISQLESGLAILSLQPVVLHDLAQRVCEDLRGKAAERLVLIENRIPPEFEVSADADRLQQVIFNLVENAIKYGRETGRVTIQAEYVGVSRVNVSVGDDGPGIPLEAQPRVFERFYRVDRARSRDTGGTGLGLAIVKHIVQAHGGTVGVTSEPGGGTKFSFTLPRQAIDQVPSATTPSELAEWTKT